MRDRIDELHEETSCLLGLLRFLSSPDPQGEEERDILTRYESNEEYESQRKLLISSQKVTKDSMEDIEKFLKCRKR